MCCWKLVHVHKERHRLSIIIIRWTPSNPATFGTNCSVLINKVATFQGSFCTSFWDFSLYRGGHISGVLSRGEFTVQLIY